MKKTRYTEKETAEMIDMKNQGATYKEIAEMTGRTEKAVGEHLRLVERREAMKDKGIEPKAEKTPEKEPETIEIEGKTLVKQKTLNDFTVRELIKNLYDRGCRLRIRNNKPVIITERIINLADII